MFTKRSLIALTCLLTLIVGAGCSTPTNPPKPQPEAKPAYKGKLTLWAAPGFAGYPAPKPAGTFYADEAKAFAAKHSDITVDVRLFDSPRALEAALLAGGETPDVAFARYLPALAPRLADIEPALGAAAAEYLPNALAAFHKAGIPALLDVPVLALNEQRFNAAGVSLPANGTWTYAEMENSLRRLSTTGTSGLGFYQVPGYHEWWPFVSGLLTPELQVAPGAEAGFARLAQYRKEGLLHPDTGKLKAEETWAQFARGEFAVMPVSPWAIPLLTAEPYRMKLTVAGFPGGETVGYTYGLLLFKQAEPLKLDAALSLARHLASGENQARLAAETGLMPALKAAPNPFQADPALTRAFQLAATQRPLPAGPAFDQAEQAMARELTLAVLGARDPKASLQAIQSAIAPAAK
ncbi:MAG TPA: extracellular solute-binding protein [Symbiobacteriaceae bacterium]|nr:extracellular solute-binding protein [Symbiobacteriaceae bacterium]